MIDVRTGTTKPCPDCGSAEVRWRGRRIYDVPLTVSRYVVELFAGAVSGQARGKRGSGYTYRGRQIAIRSDMLEAKTGLRTAHLFWKCPECHHKGQSFAQPPKQPRVDDRTRPPAGSTRQPRPTIPVRTAARRASSGATGGSTTC